MKNLKIYRKFLSILFAGTVLTSLSGCEKKQKETPQENLIGHIDVMPDKIPSTDFICYNIGNHEQVGITDQDKTLKKCENNNISLSIIIDSEATEMLDIYEDIEFTKSILEKYNVDLPVYLNIEKIINNDNLKITDKANLINEFLQLAKQNNMYIGLYGTSAELNLINEYCIPITKQYDCFVIEDGITEYNGLSSIRQDKFGNIKSFYEYQDNNNLANHIKLKNMNNKIGFKQNGYHAVKENENIQEIAIRYNLSINEILSFNNLEKEDIIPGLILRLPNQIQNKTELIFPTLSRKKTALYRGIDISHHQGEASNINFKELSKNIDFIILKIGEQTEKNFNKLQEDICFKDYYEKCDEFNIPIGGYYVTHATTPKEAQQEATLIIDRIKNLNITFPIYIDYETESIYEKEWKELKQNGELKQIFKTLSSMFDKAGLRFGIYTNLSRYNEMVDLIGLENLEQYEIWLSKPNDYTKQYQVMDNGPICKTDDGRYQFACDMNQVSWTMTDLGISNDQGYVDYNLCYKDYKKQKTTVSLPPDYKFETKQYKRKDTKKTIRIICKTSESIFGILLIIYIYGHRKRIKRKILKLKRHANNKQEIIMNRTKFEEPEEYEEKYKEEYKKVKVI